MSEDLSSFQREWSNCFHGENRLKYLFKAAGFFHEAEIINLGYCWEEFEIPSTDNRFSEKLSLYKYMISVMFLGKVYNLDILEYVSGDTYKIAHKVVFEGFREDAFSVNGKDASSVLGLNECETADFYEFIDSEFHIHEKLKDIYQNDISQYAS